MPFPVIAEKRMLELDTDAGELVVRLRKGVASALDGSSIAEGRDVGSPSVLLDGEPVPFSEPFWLRSPPSAPTSRSSTASARS